jgi:putative salt-induced outer membrane protein
MNVRALILIASCLTPVAVWCDDAPPPPPQGVWTGKGQAGYTSSQGNSESKSANAALDMALLEDPWKHSFHLAGLYGQSAGIVSADRWETAWQSDFNLTKQLYGFGGLRYQRDQFNGFQYQASVAAGIGYKIFDTNAVKLDVQAGGGYKKFRPEDLTKDASGEVTSRTLGPLQDEAIATFGVNYSQALTGTTTLTDQLLIEAGSENTLITNTAALAVKISTKLALSVGYNFQENTNPPPGLKRIDTLETVNLVYSF